MVADIIRRSAGPLALLGFAFSLSSQAPQPSFRLYGPVTEGDVLLVDTNGTAVHTWSSTYRPGLNHYLLPDGGLLRTIRTGSPPGVLGGSGGGIQKQALDGTVLWEYRYDSGGVWSHHDVEPMPNGNVLMIAWEDKTVDEAVAQGRAPGLVTGTVFRPDHIIEVVPTTGQIVWEWHVWDHLIQEFDSTKPNYGVLADHPEKIDINYPPIAAACPDWNHCNSVEYDPVHDWVVISSFQFNEVWIVDHSTTTAEAAGSTGGNYGKGGDLLYRWGNPVTYRRGLPREQKLFNQHSASIVPEGYPGAGHVLLFNNNPPTGSEVLEIALPLDASGRFVLQPGQPYGPAAPVWSHSGGFQSHVLSSARRARNGNTLICSGAEGRVFEVTPQGREVWTRSGSGGCFEAHYVDHYLWADRSTLSVSSGGTVRFELIAGSEYAGDIYWMLGSASGTTPGFSIGGVPLPLNPDGYFATTLTFPNTFPFGTTLGVLDGLGRAQATFTLPPGLTPLVGLRFDHAYAVLDATSRRPVKASQPVPLDLVN